MSTRWDEFRNPDQDFIISQFNTPSEAIVAPPLLPTATSWNPLLIEKKVLLSDLDKKWQDSTPQSAQIVRGVAKQTPGSVVSVHIDDVNKNRTSNLNERQRVNRKSHTLYSDGKACLPESMQSVGTAAESLLRFVDPSNFDMMNIDDSNNNNNNNVEEEDSSNPHNIGTTFLTDLASSNHPNNANILDTVLPDVQLAHLEQPIVSATSITTSMSTIEEENIQNTHLITPLPCITGVGEKYTSLDQLPSSLATILTQHKQTQQQSIVTLYTGSSLITALQQVYAISHCLLAHSLILQNPPPCPYIPLPCTVPSENILHAMLNQATQRGILNQKLLQACLQTPQAQLLLADGFLLTMCVLFPKPTSTIDTNQDITLHKLRQAFPYVDEKYPIIDLQGTKSLQRIPSFPLRKNEQAQSLDSINNMLQTHISKDVHALFATLLPRMARAHCSFFLSLNTEARDSILPYVTDLLAQNTFLALAYAFPYNIQDIKTTVAKQTISNFFSFCMSGVRSILSPSTWLVPFTAKNTATYVTEIAHTNVSQQGVLRLLQRLKTGTQEQHTFDIYNQCKDALPEKVLDRILSSHYLSSDEAILLLLGSNPYSEEAEKQQVANSQKMDFQVCAVPPTMAGNKKKSIVNYISKEQFKGHSLFVWLFQKLHSSVTPMNQDGISDNRLRQKATTKVTLPPAATQLNLPEEEQMHNTRRHGSLSKSLNQTSLEQITNVKYKKNPIDIVMSLKTYFVQGTEAIQKQALETKEKRMLYKSMQSKAQKGKIEGNRLLSEFTRKLATLKRAAKSRRHETVTSIMKQRQVQKMSALAHEKHTQNNNRKTSPTDESSDQVKIIWGSVDTKHKKNIDTQAKATLHTSSLLNNLTLQTRDDVMADDDLVIMRRVAVKATEMRVTQKSTLAKYNRKQK